MSLLFSLLFESNGHFMCLLSPNSFATLQNVLLIHVKHTNIAMHVLTNETQYHTDFTFHTFDIIIQYILSHS